MTDLRDQIDSIVTTKIATAILPAVFTTGHEKLAKEATDEIAALLKSLIAQRDAGGLTTNRSKHNGK